jgi:hypothetical protein
MKSIVSVSQEMSRISWNLKVHYLVHKNIILLKCDPAFKIELENEGSRFVRNVGKYLLYI